MPTAKPETNLPRPSKAERKHEDNVVEQARATRPRATARTAPRPAKFTPETAVTFKPRGGVDSLIVKVGFGPSAGDARDEELTEAALAALGERYLYFRNGMYVSTIPAVTAWLRHRLKTGKTFSYYEHVPQPTARRQGDETIVIGPNGERLMTYDEALAIHQRLSAHATATGEAPPPAPDGEVRVDFDNGVNDFAIAKPEPDAKHRARNVQSRVSSATMRGTNSR